MKAFLYRDEESFMSEKLLGTSQFNLAGLDHEANEIREIMQLCLQKSPISPLFQTRSVLLHGKSGTGKTSIAKALAKESGASCIMLFAHDIYNKASLSVEDMINEKFQIALEKQPSIIIIDEIDILCPTRSSRITDLEKRTTSILMQMLDKLNEHKNCRVFIISTTNKIDNIDPAFRRAGRLDREIEISTPTPNSRKEILNKTLNMSSVKFEDSILQEMAMNTHGFVAADLLSLCSRACFNAAKRQDIFVTLEDFRLALKKVIPSAMREVQVEVRL